MEKGSWEKELTEKECIYCRRCHWRPSVSTVCSVSNSLDIRERVLDFIMLS